LKTASLISALIKRAHRGKDVIDRNGTFCAGRLAQRWLIPNRGPIGGPGCEDSALNFGLEARMMDNIEGV
jgi:hypothetical protein